jgi:hypothetical protein
MMSTTFLSSYELLTLPDNSIFPSAFHDNSLITTPSFEITLDVAIDVAVDVGVDVAVDVAVGSLSTHPSSN